MGRVFGPTKSVKAGHKYNKLSSKVFFNRYPEMQDLFINYLTRCGTIGLDSSIAVYPVLIILGRLIPNTDDIGYKTGTIKILQTQLIKYLASPVWIVRVAAAKAVSSLSTLSPLETIGFLMTSFSKETTIADNFAHGLIKTIRYLFEDLMENQVVINDDTKTISEIVMDICNRLMAVIVRRNAHSPCVSEFVEMLEMVWRKYPDIIQNVSMPDIADIRFVWQVKLLIIKLSCQNMQLDAAKTLVLKVLQCDDYQCRQEMLSQLCSSCQILDKYFSVADLDVLRSLWLSETCLSVESLWIKLIVAVLAKSAKDDYMAASRLAHDLLSRLMNITDKRKIRKETFWALLESVTFVWKVSCDGTDSVRDDSLNAFIQLLKSSSTYDNDVETRLSVARAMINLIRWLMSTGAVINFHLIEIIFVQMNDEEEQIRHFAADCCSSVLGTSDSLTPFEQMVNLKAALRESHLKCTAPSLIASAPIGYKPNLSSGSRISVFDSEELNFYYDFIEVHSFVDLNISSGRDCISTYPLADIINAPNKFASYFQEKLAV